jgi:hypothetical protein
VAGHVVRRAALVDVVDRRCALQRRAHAVAIVLDDEHAGQLPQRRHVERLMERAGVHHGLAHEAHDALVAATILDRETDARRERDVTAHDSVSAKKVRVRVEHVHRAALAKRTSVLPPEELRHDRTGCHPARECLTVVAIGGDDVVVRAQHAQRARAHRLLANVQMAEAADLAQRIRLSDAFLEAALEEHGVQKLHVACRIRGLCFTFELFLGSHGRTGTIG